MKIYLSILLILISCSSVAAPYDYSFSWRNNLNVLSASTHPDPNKNAIMYFNDTTNQLAYMGIGNGLSISSGNLNVTFPIQVVSWNDLADKPIWTSVFDGSYSSLTNTPQFTINWNQITLKPTTFTPSAHQHTSFDITDISHGVGRDLITAPSYDWVRSVFQDGAWEWMDDVETAGGISAVGLSNDYNDLDNAPDHGTSASLDVALSGNAASGQVVKGDDTRLSDARTPAAHNQAWSTITLTPTTRAGYGITDAEASGAAAAAQAYAIQRGNHTGTQTAATISDFNSAADARVAAGITGKENSIPAGTASQYWRGDKTWQPFPTIPTQTSQLTNNSGYATGSYVDSQVATKLTIPTGTTSQVVLGNGSLGALPVPQVIQRTRVQTDASGNYTWTYPVAYPSGVVPVISAISESSSSTIPQGVQIVGVPTNTSATFKVINLPSTSVLSIVVLGAPTGSQAYIHLTAVAP